METRDVLTDAFGRIKEEVHSAADGLAAAGLNYRPDADANSIGWLVWHLARVQDDHVADLADRRQVYVTEGWAAKLGLTADERDIGYGHTSEQVAAVKFDRPDSLVAYFDRVSELSLEYVAAVDGAELDRIVDTSWDPPVSAGVRIVSVIDDCAQHTGQANYVRGMFERLGAS
ncbi:MAG: DUF664 domain-containing protein [bacterium]|nr:DUF664 domain-containing protein [bacterium]